MICIHHNKDLDGFTSGAIVKLKYPDCQLIGWDYAEPVPDFAPFVGEDVIMIDVSFKLPQLLELGRISRLTVIDHHIGLKRDVDEYRQTSLLNFTYIYEDGVAACEIGWKYFFPTQPLPKAVELLGKYDTWREYGTKQWTGAILPFQFYMRTVCTSAETFPPEFLISDIDFIGEDIGAGIETGRAILRYQEQQDMLACQRSAFEATVLGGLRGLCLNARAFSSETMKTLYDESRHDVMLGFEYTGRKWSVSLRSTRDDVNVSVLAKARGGGGHAKAAGFEVETFEDIFN